MKKWNSPEIEVLEINKTANGMTPSYEERSDGGVAGMGTNPLLTLVGADDVIEAIASATPDTADNAATEKLS